MRVRLLVTVGVVLLAAGTVLAAGALIWLSGHAYDPNGMFGKQLAMARLGAILGGVVALLGLASCAAAAIRRG
jgi:hypothetical protein